MSSVLGLLCLLNQRSSPFDVEIHWGTGATTDTPHPTIHYVH